MPITTDNQEELLDWARSVIGFSFREKPKAIARVDESGIRAVVVYDNFTGCDCSMHIASDGSRRWMSREFLLEAFHFPFIQCGYRRVTGLVPAKNAVALRFDQRLGFRYEGLMRNALKDDDLIILGMLRSECLFIPRGARHD